MNPHYLETAFTIGTSLCTESIHDEGRCNWLGYTNELIQNRASSVLKTCGADFYGGTSGIAYFLSALHHATGDRLLHKTALSAMRHALHQANTLALSPSSFFSGSAGLGYSLFRCGKWLNEETFCGEGITILKTLAQHTIATHETDVISGPAGTIPVLLLLADELNEQWPADIARSMGEYLLGKAIKHEYGWAWDTGAGEVKQLTGLAHGTSGIAVAFLELFRSDKDQRWLHAAEQAFAYERHWFVPAQKNWPDFRDFGGPKKENEEQHCAMAWCHGAPGIGLARLRYFEMTGDSLAKEEALFALESTEKNLLPSLESFTHLSNYSLCHGIGGNVELLQYAAKTLNTSSYQNSILSAAETGIRWKNEQGIPWRCGTNEGRENPSLMLGLAGIGYYYLRCWNENYPSVLLPTAGLGASPAEKETHPGAALSVPLSR